MKLTPFLIIPLFVLAACGGGLESKIPGKYGLKIVSEKKGNADEEKMLGMINDGLKKAVVELKADKTVSMKMDTVDTPGTWSVEKEVVSITSQGNTMKGKVAENGDIEITENGGQQMPGKMILTRNK